MTGRWELNDEQWAVVEPVLRPERRADNRGRPWHDTRAVLNGVFWVLGTGAQWRELPEKYPAYQTCHRRFQQWIRSGKLERALKLLARHLHERGQLNLEEAFVDATFASAKKGASRSAPPAAAGGRRSSLSPLITVFLSPYLCKALCLPSASLWKRFLSEAFSMNSRRGLSATMPTIGPARPHAPGRIWHRDDRAQPAQPQQESGWPQAASLPQALESGETLRMDAQLPPTRHPVGIPHRELPRLRPPCLPSHAAQVFMRPLVATCGMDYVGIDFVLNPEVETVETEESLGKKQP